MLSLIPNYNSALNSALHNLQLGDKLFIYKIDPNKSSQAFFFVTCYTNFVVVNEECVK